MDERGATRGGRAIPDLILYSRPGCHLCAEARTIIVALLAQRAEDGLPSPGLIERDITTNPTWEGAFFTTIPVVELGDRRLELATSAAKLRALLATLEAPTRSPSPSAAPG